jgi:rhodanese-related sulfurtransferase
MQEISHKQVQRLLIRGNARAVEVLAEQHYREAHLPGAVNVPFDEDFDLHIRYAIPDKNTPVIVYCADRDCALSPKAAKQLDRLGYNKVFEYRGGKADWQRAGLQVERGPAQSAP